MHCVQIKHWVHAQRNGAYQAARTRRTRDSKQLTIARSQQTQVDALRVEREIVVSADIRACVPLRPSGKMTDLFAVVSAAGALALYSADQSAPLVATEPLEPLAAAQHASWSVAAHPQVSCLAVGHRRRDSHTRQ